MKMNCIRRSVAMQIDAEDVSLLKMTYICRYSNHSGTYGTTGCKQRFYADPYDALKYEAINSISG